MLRYSCTSVDLPISFRGFQSGGGRSGGGVFSCVICGRGTVCMYRKGHSLSTIHQQEKGKTVEDGQGGEINEEMNAHGRTGNDDKSNIRICRGIGWMSRQQEGFYSMKCFGSETIIAGIDEERHDLPSNSIADDGRRSSDQKEDKKATVVMSTIDNKIEKVLCAGNLFYSQKYSAMRCSGLGLEVAIAEEDDEENCHNAFASTSRNPVHHRSHEAIADARDLLASGGEAAVPWRNAAAVEYNEEQTAAQRIISSLSREWKEEGGWKVINRGLDFVREESTEGYHNIRAAVTDLGSPWLFAAATWERMMTITERMRLIGDRVSVIGVRCKQLVGKWAQLISEKDGPSRQG